MYLVNDYTYIQGKYVKVNFSSEQICYETFQEPVPEPILICIRIQWNKRILEQLDLQHSLK